MLLGFGLATLQPGQAQPPNPTDNQPAAPEQSNSSPPGQSSQDGTAPEPTGLWERSHLLGTIGGVRDVLGDHGISLGLAETSEVLGNPTGGRAQGAIYEGLTSLSLGIDLEKAIGLPGAIFNVSAFQIHGRGLSVNNINNLHVASSIEADRSTRLFELWIQQSFLDGKIDVKVGQQSADLEFATTQYGGLFINSSFGWPTLSAVDLPSGGPAYPLAALGVRLRAKPTDATAILLGVFDGSPAGLGPGDPQIRNPSGTNFDLSSGVFVIGEVQYAINQDADTAGLPGTYKLGGWYNSNTFTDPAFAASTPGTTIQRRGDWSVYAVMDQLVYRPAGSTDSGAGVFARAAGAPDNRNQINVFVDAGITYKGAFQRESDTMGLGIGWARISNAARAGDRASATPGSPIRSGEFVLEASYQAVVAPWWVVQPDIQYVFNPGGGIANPNQPEKRLGDSLILGIRTIVTF